MKTEIGKALYPLEDPEAWAKRYSLRLLEVPCIRCDRMLLLSRPWAIKGVRGLTAYPCKCGEPATPLIFTYK